VADLPTLFNSWSGFYALIGSAAAALTGLMFVVITLLQRNEQAQAKAEGMAIFNTPTVLHFAAALFIAAVLEVPWHSSIVAAAVVGLAGLYGLVHILRVAYRIRRLSAYAPDLEDRIWYNIFPAAAYAAVLAGALLLLAGNAAALFAVAAGVVSLIFIGIRNAWDLITYFVIRN
jgi:hypothetical protein